MEHVDLATTTGDQRLLPAVATVDPDVLDEIPAQLAPWANEVDGYEPNILRGLE